MRAIINGVIITEKEVMRNHVLIFDEKIREIIPKENFHECEYDLIDAEGDMVIPGLIDLHIHGAGGCDVMDGTPEALDKISDKLAEVGVTSFLPTTMTMEKKYIIDALENIRHCLGNNRGAKILGVHLEGPFISKKFKGAQDESCIIKPQEEMIHDFTDIIKIITIAPEEDEEHRFIKKFKEKGIVMSMGHTDATFQEGISAIADGVNYATHTFNAMRGLHHREPGAVGAVFSKDIYCEIIADMIHVHKGFFQAFIDINGLDKVILVSDSMRAGCMEAGVYDLGGQTVYVNEDSARLSNGILAGSILKLKDGVKNIKDNTTYAMNEVINMATINSARAIGVEKEIGSIEIGKGADLVLMDSNYEIKHTIIDGKSVYKR